MASEEAGSSAAGDAPPPLPRYNFSNTPLPAAVTALLPVPGNERARTPLLIRHSARLLLVALALGVAADALLYRQRIGGVGFPLFMLTLLGGLVTLGMREGTPLRVRNILPLAAALLFFAAMTAVRASSFLTFLNIAACAGLLPMLGHFYASGDLRQMGFGALLGTPGRVFGNTLFRAAPLIREASGNIAKGEEARQKAAPVVRGLLLACPVLLVFLWLLSSADAVFSHALGSVTGWFDTDYIAERIQRGFLVLGVSWLIAGGFVYALSRRDPETAPESRVFLPPLGFVEGMIVLTSVLSVFIAFIAIQFAYLFGGSERVLTVPGLTYAAYARRGFAELATVAVLTLLLILSLSALTNRDEPRRKTIFNTAATLLICSTQLLLLSAFQRMNAYEAAYGATELRLYVDVFILWLGIALFWFAAQLWHRQPASFAPATLACACGFLLTLNAVNPDACIAHRNLLHYQKTGKLDEYTLRALSDDAIPELCAALPTATGTTRQFIAARLRVRLTQIEAGQRQNGWPSAHYAQAAAARLIKASEPLLPTQKDACRTLYQCDACL